MLPFLQRLLPDQSCFGLLSSVFKLVFVVVVVFIFCPAFIIVTSKTDNPIQAIVPLPELELLLLILKNRILIQS